MFTLTKAVYDIAMRIKTLEELEAAYVRINDGRYDTVLYNLRKELDVLRLRTGG